MSTRRFSPKSSRGSSFNMLKKQYVQADVCRVCGLPPGQFQHWVNRGLLQRADKKIKSGKKRLYSKLDIVEIMILSELSRFGMRPKQASEFANKIFVSIFNNRSNIEEVVLSGNFSRYFILWSGESGRIESGIRSESYPPNPKSLVYICIDLVKVMRFVMSNT